MMILSPRQRILHALDFQPVDRLPRDLGGMRSTSLSAFAYPALVQALGLPPRLPRVEDTMQMLALPDLDVLDALEIDVVTILDGVTNAFERSETSNDGLWYPYDFNGRLPALVRAPDCFSVAPDGVIWQGTSLRMPPTSFVFDEEHGGQPLDLSAHLPRLDLDAYRQFLQSRLLSEGRVQEIASLCRRVRQSTDRAVFFNDSSLQVPIGIGAFQGVAIFPMLCLTEPDYIVELHEIAISYSLENARRLLPVIREDIDLIMVAADDWGTQNNLFASPKLFRQLFLPYYRRFNDLCHQLAPQVKLFLHSCGAIYSLIDDVIAAGFDVLNPVQWPAGGHSALEWKRKASRRIALWGGGVNAQATLLLGSLEDIVREVQETTAILGEDSGYVFCNIHNLLAEVAPEKIIAMYRAAK